MASLLPSLTSVAHDLQPQIQSQLGGFFGGMLRAYLPQTWVFKTELEEASLTVDPSGVVTVVKGGAKNPDVTIEIGHDRLLTALRTRSRAAVPPGPLAVTPHTSKGKTAFDFLRSRLGL